MFQAWLFERTADAPTDGSADRRVYEQLFEFITVPHIGELIRLRFNETDSEKWRVIDVEHCVGRTHSLAIFIIVRRANG